MAYTDGYRIIRNAPYRHMFTLFDQHNNAVTGASFAAGAVQLYLNDSAAWGPTPPSVVTTRDPVLAVDLTAAQMAGDTIYMTVEGTSGSPSQSHVHAIYLQPEPCLDSGLVAGVGTSQMTLASTSPSVADILVGATLEIVRGAGKGTVRTIVNQDGSRIVSLDRDWTPATGAPAAGSSVYVIKGSGVPLTQDDTNSTIRVHSDIQMIHGDPDAAANLELLYEGAFITSSVSDTSPSATSFDAEGTNLVQTNDFYNEMLLVFTSGGLKGIPRKVSDYEYDAGAGTYDFTVEEFPASPANSDTFILIALIA